jgi:hypothetical protein
MVGAGAVIAGSIILAGIFGSFFAKKEQDEFDTIALLKYQCSHLSKK